MLSLSVLFDDVDVMCVGVLIVMLLLRVCFCFVFSRLFSSYAVVCFIGVLLWFVAHVCVCFMRCCSMLCFCLRVLQCLFDCNAYYDLYVCGVCLCLC